MSDCPQPRLQIQTEYFCIQSEPSCTPTTTSRHCLVIAEFCKQVTEHQINLVTLGGKTYSFSQQWKQLIELLLNQDRVWFKMKGEHCYVHLKMKGGMDDGNEGKNKAQDQSSMIFQPDQSVQQFPHVDNDPSKNDNEIFIKIGDPPLNDITDREPELSLPKSNYLRYNWQNIYSKESFLGREVVSTRSAVTTKMIAVSHDKPYLMTIPREYVEVQNQLGFSGNHPDMKIPYLIRNKFRTPTTSYYNVKTVIKVHEDRDFECTLKTVQAKQVAVAAILDPMYELLLSPKLERTHQALVAQMKAMYPIVDYTGLTGAFFPQLTSENQVPQLGTFFTKVFLDYFTTYMLPSMPNNQRAVAQMIPNNARWYIGNNVMALNNVPIQNPFAVHLGNILSGHTLAWWLPSIRQNEKHVQMLLRWCSSWPQNKPTVNAAGLSWQVTSTSVHIPASQGCLFFSDETSVGYQIPAGFVNPSLGDIASTLRFLMSLYGDLLNDSISFGIQSASRIICQYAPQELRNEGMEWRDVRYRTLTATYDWERICMPKDQNSLFLLAPLLKIGLTKDSELWKFMETSPHIIARQLLWQGMCIANSCTLSNFTLSITSMTYQIAHFGPQMNTPEHMIKHVQTTLGVNFEDDISLWSQVCNQMACCFYNFQIHPTLQPMFDPTGDDSNPNLRSLDTIFDDGDGVCITLMYDTLPCMWKVPLCQLNMTSRSAVKWSKHRGPDPDENFNLTRYRCADLYQDYSEYEFMSAGGSAYNMYNFVSMQESQRLVQAVCNSYEFNNDIQLIEQYTNVPFENAEWMKLEYCSAYVEFDPWIGRRRTFGITFGNDQIKEGNFIIFNETCEHIWIELIQKGVPYTQLGRHQQAGIPKLSGLFGPQHKMQVNPGLNTSMAPLMNSQSNIFGSGINSQLQQSAVMKQGDQVMKNNQAIVTQKSMMQAVKLNKIEIKINISELSKLIEKLKWGPTATNKNRNRAMCAVREFKELAQTLDFKFMLTQISTEETWNQPWKYQIAVKRMGKTATIQVAHAFGLSYDLLIQKIGGEIAYDDEKFDQLFITTPRQMKRYQSYVSENRVLQYDNQIMEKYTFMGTMLQDPVMTKPAIEWEMKELEAIRGHKLKTLEQVPVQHEKILMAGDHSQKWANMVKMSGLNYSTSSHVFDKDKFQQTAKHVTCEEIECNKKCFYTQQKLWMHNPDKWYSSWNTMQQVEDAYQQKGISRRLLARWRKKFAPSCLTPDDYEQLTRHTLKKWKKAFDSKSFIRVTKIDKTFCEKMFAIFYLGQPFNDEMKLQVKKLHPAENVDQSSRTKISLCAIIDIINHYCRLHIKGKQQDGYAGDCFKASFRNVCQHAAKLVSSDNGWSSNAVGSHLIALFGNDSYRKMLNIFRNHRITTLKIDDYIQWAKSVHDSVRKMGCDWTGRRLSSIEYVQMQYLQDLAGRGSFKVDYEAEIEHRTAVPNLKKAFDGEVFSTTEYVMRRNEQLNLFFKSLDIKRQGDDTFNQFVKKRQEWVKTGSALGAVDSLKDSSKIRLNKRGAASNIGGNVIQQYLTSLPARYASTALKYENGKNRFLYPVSLIYYIIETYGITGVENKLANSELIGLAQDIEAKLLEMRLMANKCKQKSPSWAYDFKDFNSQHSAADQSAVWDGLRNIHYNAKVKDKAWSDYDTALQWLSLSMRNTWLPNVPEHNCKPWQGTTYIEMMPFQYQRDIDPGGLGESHKPKFDDKINFQQLRSAGLHRNTNVDCHLIKKGLFSGQRSTDFINTCLNRVQAKIAYDDYKQILGHWSREPVTLSKHKGDDIGALVDSWMTSVALNVIMAINGSEGKDEKILNGNGQLEFLRNFYQSDGIIYGYLNRSIPNLISKDLQGEPMEHLDPQQILSSLGDQIGTCVNRGLNSKLAILIQQEIAQYWSQIKDKGANLGKLDLKRINTSVIDGGQGVSFYGMPSQRLKISGKYQFKMKKPRLIFAEQNIRKYAANEYTKFIVESMPSNQLKAIAVEVSDEISSNMHFQNVETNLSHKQYSKFHRLRAENIMDEQKDNKYWTKIQVGQKNMENQAKVKRLTKQIQNTAKLDYLSLKRKLDTFDGGNMDVAKPKIEQIGTIKAMLKIKDVNAIKLIFQQYAKGCTQAAQRKKMLVQFLYQLWGDADKLDSALYWATLRLDYSTFEEMIFGHVTFDDVSGHDVHRDLTPVMRRKALQCMENLNVGMNTQLIQEFMRIYEIEFCKQTIEDQSIINRMKY